MKPSISLLITSALVGGMFSAFGQGVVNFANASSIGWLDPTFDRFVHWGSAIPSPLQAGGLVSSNHAGLDLSSLRASLYFAASTQNDWSQFIAASGGPATFRSSTSVNAGAWLGHTDTLDSFGPGTTANLFVVVWDSSLSPDPLLSGARAGLWGRSTIFQYTVPTYSAHPYDFLMAGLTAFTVEFTVPYFTLQPRGRDVFAGTNVTFIAQAIGSPDPAYQWRFNGTNLSAATDSSCTKAMSKPTIRET